MEAVVDEDAEHSGRCVACLEPIRREARVCPHCRSVQHVTSWRRVADWLKWIGGIVTVISLLSGVLSLNALYKEWRGKQAAVEELVTAASWLIETRAYEHAWEMYQQALDLSPGSAAARGGQVELAMLWLGNIRVVGEGAFSDVVDRLLPVLHRGLSGAGPKRSATLLAHIGWAYLLKHRDIRIYEQEARIAFQRALELDPANVHANAMFGYWLVSFDDNMERGAGLFRQALAAGEQRQWVRRLQLNSLAEESTRYRGRVDLLRPYMQELLVALDEMRIADEPRPTERVRSDVLSNYGTGYGAENVEALLDLLPAGRYLATVKWLNQDLQPVGSTVAQTDFLIARLTEANRDEKEALRLYLALAEVEHRRASFNVQLREAIERLGGPLPEHLNGEGGTP